MHDVGRLLASEVEAVKRLIDLLTQEQSALKAATPEALAEIGPQKTGLIEHLNLLESQRVTLIAASGKDARTAMEQWLGKRPADSAAKTQWQDLLELARQAKSLNELNGKLLNMHLQQTSQALAALSRQSAPGLYGSDGQASALTGSRIVDSA